jgi:hypothetical protein
MKFSMKSLAYNLIKMKICISRFIFVFIITNLVNKNTKKFRLKHLNARTVIWIFVRGKNTRLPMNLDDIIARVLAARTHHHVHIIENNGENIYMIVDIFAIRWRYLKYEKLDIFWCYLKLALIEPFSGFYKIIRINIGSFITCLIEHICRHYTGIHIFIYINFINNITVTHT